MDNTRKAGSDDNVIAIARLYDSLKLPQKSDDLTTDAKCIRVLDIFAPRRWDPSSPLEGRLRVQSLANGQPFAALSYVWGIDNEHHRLACEDALLPISANGHSALKHLRRKLGSFTIWIDALCINQSDIGEKERQIPLMSEIFSLASPTYLWLGEGDVRSDRAMKLLGKTGILDCFLEDIERSRWHLEPRVWRAYWRMMRIWRAGDKNPVPRSYKS